MKLLILLQTASTLTLVGLIWLIQIVHYPLFNRVGLDEFVAYEAAHTRLITFVVAPLMLLEAATAALLLIFRPAGISLFQVWLGAGLLAIIWFSTAFIQVPQHKILSAGFDLSAYQILVTSNWIRTIAWSARGFLVLWMLWVLMR